MGWSQICNTGCCLFDIQEQCHVRWHNEDSKFGLLRHPLFSLLISNITSRNNYQRNTTSQSSWEMLPLLCQDDGDSRDCYSNFLMSRPATIIVVQNQEADTVTVAALHRHRARSLALIQCCRKAQYVPMVWLGTSTIQKRWSMILLYFFLPSLTRVHLAGRNLL